jgi:multidrug efflux system membrane fusion protein
MKRFCASSVGLLVLAIVTANAQAKTQQPPVVQVSQPVQRVVIDFVQYTGRTSATQSVEIKPRVTGFLVQIHFKDGSQVRKGDVLFEVDPLPYEAAYQAARAEQAASEASLELAKAHHQLLQGIVAKVKDAVSPLEVIKAQQAVEQAAASVELSKAKVKTAKNNLDWTKVVSPIDGRIGRASLTPGNLVTKDQTILATVVSLDPLYIYFDMDERTLLEIKRAVANGKLNAPKEGSWPIGVGLADEAGYAHEAVLDFVDNQVNPKTGTIKLRAVLANPKLPKVDGYLLLPGMSVRVRLALGQPHAALLIADRAIWSDQGQKAVYVVDKDNKVEVRRVTLGQLQEDGLRVIADGLKKDDWVVVGGLKQLKPGVQVQSEKVTR